MSHKFCWNWSSSFWNFQKITLDWKAFTSKICRCSLKNLIFMCWQTVFLHSKICKQTKNNQNWKSLIFVFLISSPQNIPRHIIHQFNSISWEPEKIIDFSIATVRNWPDVFRSCSICSIKKKKLYLRRSQNNAYNHDGLVDSDTVSRKTFFVSPFFSSLSLSHCLSSLFLFSVLSATSIQRNSQNIHLFVISTLLLLFYNYVSHS